MKTSKNRKKQRLFLIDAHAYLHRAYHVPQLSRFSTSKGEPTGALFGFAGMLFKLIREEKPDRIAVCFDLPGPTFRHKISDEYKATRKEIDENLIKQLGQAIEMTEAMGLTCVSLSGFEADDLMATLARRGVKDGYEAILVTGDKDALQLVGPGIRVYNVAKNLWMDPPQVEEKFGIPPAAMLDYLAIVGDASDNVAGVRGVGPVGAKSLITRYGSLVGAIKAARAGDKAIKPGTAKALIEGEKDAEKAVSLIRLAEDVPLKVKPADCRYDSPDADKAKRIFERLEFFAFLEKLVPGYSAPSSAPRRAAVPAAANGNAPPPQHPSQGAGARRGSALDAAPPPQRTSQGAGARRGSALDAAPSASAPSEAAPGIAVTEVPPEKLAAEIKKAKTLIVTALLDPDDTLLSSARVLLAVGLEDGRTAFWEGEPPDADKKWLGAALSGKASKAGYDLKQTRRTLELAGLKLKGSEFDAMLADYCLDASCRAAVGKNLPELLRRRVSLALGHRELSRRMEEAEVQKLYDDIELPLSEVLRAMEDEGITLDAPVLKKLGVEFAREMTELKSAIDELAGGPVNPNSPKQLAELLYDKLGLPVAHKTAKGGRSTDEAALSTLARTHPIPAKVLEYRELSKLKSNYIDGMLSRLNPSSGRVHTTFDQTGTATGRLSSQDPNLQNIPIRTPRGMRIRGAFIARKGCVLLSADYSQIDLRVLAHVSGDPVLREAFAQDEDIHRRTAAEVFHVAPESVDKEMRRRAKAINFGIVYGQTPFGLSNQLGITHAEAAGLIKKYFERYAGVNRWIKENILEARHRGSVRTWAGRVRVIAELGAKNAALRQFGERAATNTPIQGGAADVIKVAMLKIHEGLANGKFQARMLLQIHDELLFDVPPAELKAFGAWVRAVMEETTLDVPFRVDMKTGRDWSAMESFA